MNRLRPAAVLLPAVGLALGLTVLAPAGERASHPPAATTTAPAAAETVDPDALAEARLRAGLLHETIHGALQVMHRDFFRDGDDRLPIPSGALEDVFAELEKTWRVRVEWLAVDTDAMNPAHAPDSPFERSAAEAITAGRETFDATDAESYRFAGRVVLGNQCLKCHVPGRTNLEDRSAAVVITMPLDLRMPAGAEARLRR